MAKKNPVSLSGMQAALGGETPISDEMLLASQIAFENSPKNKGGATKNVIYKLLDTQIRGNFYLELIDDVKAREGDGTERMRVLRGVQTIWQKDQKDVDKDYIKANRRRLLFQKGVAIVPETDVQVIEFMDKHNGNIDNPAPAMPRNTKFFKWNPQKQAEELLKKEEVELEAIFAAKDEKESEMVKHALFLGIPFVDGLGEPLTPKGIRAGYIRYAKSNPVKFMESKGSREVEVTYLVKKALRDGKIDTGRGDRSIYWAAGGLIGKLPVSQTAQDYLVALAMNPNSEDGKAFLENLQQRVM